MEIKIGNLVYYTNWNSTSNWGVVDEIYSVEESERLVEGTLIYKVVPIQVTKDLTFELIGAENIIKVFEEITVKNNDNNNDQLYDEDFNCDWDL